MGYISIGILVFFGILLVLLELLVIPGKIIAGVCGIAMIVAGIASAYANYGATFGHFTVFGALVVIVGAIIFALKSGTWSKLMLKTEIDSTVAEEKKIDKIKVGDSGITVSRLAPMGTISVNDINYEAKASNSFIDPNVEIEIVKITEDSIIVKIKKL